MRKMIMSAVAMWAWRYFTTSKKTRATTTTARRPDGRTTAQRRPADAKR